jgi:outer membrane lipopolysaccharide assembly protein LptE/RlpB
MRRDNRGETSSSGRFVIPVLGACGFHLNERVGKFVAKLQLIAGEPFTVVDEMSGVDH